MDNALHRWHFWFRAKSRHGIHSPFVYKFLDEGYYRKDLRHLPPAQRLLLAAADHFKPRNTGAVPAYSPFATWLQEVRPELLRGQPPFDLLIFDSPEVALAEVLERPGYWHNDSVVFVGNLRNNRANYQIWVEASRRPPVNVVVETYTAGLLFFRRKQAPQHFRIRN